MKSLAQLSKAHHDQQQYRAQRRQTEAEWQFAERMSDDQFNWLSNQYHAMIANTAFRPTIVNQMVVRQPNTNRNQQIIENHCEILLKYQLDKYPYLTPLL